MRGDFYLDFFGSTKDHERLLRFALDTLDGEFVETYSEFDRDLRRFTQWSDLKGWLASPDPDHSKQLSFCVGMSRDLLRIERIELKPRTGGQFRFAARGWGLIHFLLRDAREEPNKPSVISAFARARAEREDNTGSASKWDWAAINHSCRALTSHVRDASVNNLSSDEHLLSGAAQAPGFGGCK